MTLNTEQCTAERLIANDITGFSHPLECFVFGEVLVGAELGPPALPRDASCLG